MWLMQLLIKDLGASVIIFLDNENNSLLFSIKDKAFLLIVAQNLPILLWIYSSRDCLKDFLNLGSESESWNNFLTIASSEIFLSFIFEIKLVAYKVVNVAIEAIR